MKLPPGISSVRVFFTPVLLALSVNSAVLLNSTSVAAAIEEPPALTITEHSNAPKAQAEIALLQPHSYRQNQDNLAIRANTFKDTLLPLVTWILGSAVLAMIGYKRMRNSSTGTD